MHILISLSHIARYTENGCSLLRSKIRALHPAHRASLEALLQHLWRVASHSANNGMTLESLAVAFRGAVLQGQAIVQDGVSAKARCNYSFYFFQLISSKRLVMEDLIQNAHTLFDEGPSLPPPVPSPHVTEITSTYTYGSLLSSELPHSAEVQAMNSTSGHRPRPVVGIPASNQTSFSSLPSDTTIESRLTPPPNALLNPLLGLTFPETLTEGVETTMQERAIPNARGSNAVEPLPSSTPPNVVSLPETSSVADWRLHQSRLPPHSEAVMMPQSPPESVLSSISDFTHPIAASSETRMGEFSP